MAVQRRYVHGRMAAAVTALACVGALAVASPATATAPVGASSTMARTWGVDGRVVAITPAGSAVIVAGAFSNLIGPSGDQIPASSVAKFEPATGTFDAWPVSVDGPVNAVAVDGDTVYLGGDFRHVNGALRTSLAAVSLTDGSLLSWAPSANVAVNALAVSGGYVYLGGPFNTVTDSTGPTAAPYLARISTGGVLDRPGALHSPSTPKCAACW